MIEFSPEKLLELTREHVPIQVERIAYSLGYTIRYVPLDSVDALIIVGRKGRILVKNSMSVTRKRFSISHEIGHLMRGHPLTGVMCSRIGAGLFSLAKMDNEREADEYAARLLMPSDEIDSDLKLDFSLHQAQVLSTDKYAVSLESYLVRIAKRATYPICIAHTMGTTIKWHIESSAWPEELDINGMIYDTRNKWHISELTSDDLNYDDYLIVKKTVTNSTGESTCLVYTSDKYFPAPRTGCDWQKFRTDRSE